MRQLRTPAADAASFGFELVTATGGASGNTKLATHAFRAPDRASFFLWVQPTLARILALPLFPALTPKPSSNSSPNLNQVDTLQRP